MSQCAAASSPPPTVVVVGMTGDGKSNLCTWLIGNPNVFKVSDEADSCTDIPFCYEGKCFGGLCSFSGYWKLADTPGLYDSSGRDAQNLKATIQMLKEKVKGVNAFCLVVNAQQDRMAASLKNVIKVYRGCFGPQWWSNVCVVFTKWDWDKKHGNFTADKLQARKQAWTAWFQECEQEYSGAANAVCASEIQFFAVDLPDLAMLQQRYPEDIPAILQDSRPDGVSCTGDQIRLLYRHICVVMASKPPVSMAQAVAQTDRIPEEIAKNLQKEKELRAEQEKANKRQAEELKKAQTANEQQKRQHEQALKEQAEAAKRRQDELAKREAQLVQQLKDEAKRQVEEAARREQEAKEEAKQREKEQRELAKQRDEEHARELQAERDRRARAEAEAQARNRQGGDAPDVGEAILRTIFSVLPVLPHL